MSKMSIDRGGGRFEGIYVKNSSGVPADIAEEKLSETA